MPIGTTVRTFIEALQSGQTKTTKALDAFFDNPGRHQNHPNRNDFKIRGAFDRLPTWATNALQPNLSPLELAHINSWPNDQKDSVREKLDGAIADKRRAVHFFWELGRANAESTNIEDPDEDGDITITFCSPRQKLRQVGPDDITVDVG
jgi:hypothetical protein